MARWHNDLDELSDLGVFDPLCMERSAPMDDQEAALIEALCNAATPGPLVVDDAAVADGAAVVGLPDGRTIVSLAVSAGQALDDSTRHANVQLFCKARNSLLRLLRDRQQWGQQREFLLARIRTLETALDRDESARESGTYRLKPR